MIQKKVDNHHFEVNAKVHAVLTPTTINNHVNMSIAMSTGQQIVYPFPKQQILDSSNLKEFADNNFELDEIGRKFSEWVENAMEKGEIARCEQFIFFPQCFQKNCIADL